MKVETTGRIPLKMWLDDAEEGALQQARNLTLLPFAWKWVCLMPDAHQGYGMPIGGVLATRDVIVPNAVGVDIGCGMVAARTTLTDVDEGRLKAIMGKIREAVPVGFNHHKEVQEWDGFTEAPEARIVQQELTSARKQLGTLGGGNHFIEIQKGNDGRIWAMIHSGSRNFGLKTAGDYHKKAMALCEKWASDIPDKELSFLPISSPEGHEYYDAMRYCLRFAEANRALMMDRVLACMSDVAPLEVDDRVNIHHNYAAFENHFGEDVLIHRKGATKAVAGLRGIIPGSMGAPSYIVEGLGNPESFMSCSHGAGRRMGRGAAKRTLDLADERAKMAGVVHGLRTKDDLDEAPGAYKDIDAVMSQQEDLTRIVVRLRPLASIKG